MISEQMGMWLHDRATRGETLTAEEKAQLEQWYAAEDEAEMRMLQQGMLRQDSLKGLVKEALVEMIEQQQGIFYELLVEALEEVGLARAIREGRQNDFVDEAVIFGMLEGKS